MRYPLLPQVARRLTRHVIGPLLLSLDFQTGIDELITGTWDVKIPFPQDDAFLSIDDQTQHPAGMSPTEIPFLERKRP